MPTITYDKKDLLNLIGKKLSDNELEEVINSIKPEVERISESEIVIEHYADRPDLFGIEGLARAIRFYLGMEKRKKYKVGKSQFKVRVKEVPVRPYIACAVVKNVRLNDELIKSLMNIQEVLHETMGRGRKKVAIGVHDLKKIKFPVTYTAAEHDEKIIPLESKKLMKLSEVLEKNPKGVEYGSIIKNSRKWPVYRDKKGIFSFPPIINSDRTKVTEKTKNLFIELTATEKQALLQTLNIIVTNLAERNCKIQSVTVKYKEGKEVTPNLEEQKVEIDRNLVKNIIGLDLKEKDIVVLLNKMGYEARKSKGKIEATVPSYRVDVLHPVDLVEDVAVAYGYNNLVPKIPNVSTAGRLMPLERFCSKVRNLMIGLGFTEIVRPALSNLKDQFERMNLEKRAAIEIENPVSEEYGCLRVWLLPSLMKVLSANKHREYPQNIFEIGDAVLPDIEEEVASKTIRKVAGIVCHSKASFSEIKSVTESLLRNLEVKYSLEESTCPCFIPGRGVKILVNRKVIGRFGEIRPEVLMNWQLEMPVAYFEINLEEILNPEIIVEEKEKPQTIWKMIKEKMNIPMPVLKV